MPDDRPSAPGATPTPAPTNPTGAPPAQQSGQQPGSHQPGSQQPGRAATVLAQPVGNRPMPPLHGPWPDPTLWGRRWPGPAQPPPAAGAAALIVAAVVAALSVPLGSVGVGWLTAAVAGVAALAVARRVARPVRPGGPPPLVHRGISGLQAARHGWGAITIALVSVGTIRSAGWLFVLCLATAVVTGALAAAGGSSGYALIAAAASGPVAAFRALPWVAAGLRTARRTGADRAAGTRIAATTGVSLALLVVFGALFASADAAFARILGHLVPEVDTGTIVWWCFVGACAVAVLGGAAFLRAAPPDLTGFGKPGRRVGRLEWAVPIGTLVLLFTSFVAVQLTVLFGGGGHVLRTAGLTYADYARQGFWQLLVITGLTLLVLSGAARWAPRDTATDRLLIRVLLGALTGLTLLIVASALHRMNVYADTYGLTRLRLLVALCEAWLGAVFLLVLAAGIRLRAGWLPRVAVATAALALLGLAAANPDELIAERNVDRLARIDRVDQPYLSELSPDAVPALDRLPARHRSCVLWRLAVELDSPGDWRGWNAGRERARRHLIAHPVSPPTGNCTPGID